MPKRKSASYTLNIDDDVAAFIAREKIEDVNGYVNKLLRKAMDAGDFHNAVYKQNGKPTVEKSDKKKRYAIPGYEVEL